MTIKVNQNLSKFKIGQNHIVSVKFSGPQNWFYLKERPHLQHMCGGKDRLFNTWILLSHYYITCAF